MSNFFDLDKLVLELSEFSGEKTDETSIETKNKENANNNNKSFTNEQCNYIVSQFESFAKKFNNKPYNIDNSASSTLNRSNFSSDTSSSNKIKRTLHTSKIFKHDLDQKLCVIEGIIKDLKRDDDLLKQIKSVENNMNNFQTFEDDLKENGLILTKVIDHKSISKKDFIETNLIIDDKHIDNILKVNEDPVSSFMSLFGNIDKEIKNIKRERRNSVKSSSSSLSASSSPNRSNHSSVSMTSLNKNNKKIVDSVDEEEDDDGNINPIIFGANSLNPQFLLIDDEEDNNDDEDEIQRSRSLTNDNNELLCNTNSKINIESLCEKLNTIDYTVYEDDINDYKDNFIGFEQEKYEDSKIKRLIDDTISISSYKLTSFISDKNEEKSHLLVTSQQKNYEPFINENKSEDLISSNPKLKSMPSSATIQNTELNVLDLLDVNYLLEYQSAQHTSTIVFDNKNLLKTNNTTFCSSTTNILRGGHIDALIVLATSANANVVSAINLSKNNSKTVPNQNLVSVASNENKSNFLFQEAFLTTYRTIIEPINLINKLIYRYRVFSKHKSSIKNCLDQDSKNNKSRLDEKFDLNRLKSNIKTTKLAASAARNSLALLIRVLDDLG